MVTTTVAPKVIRRMPLPTRPPLPTRLRQPRGRQPRRNPSRTTRKQRRRRPARATRMKMTWTTLTMVERMEPAASPVGRLTTTLLLFDLDAGFPPLSIYILTRLRKRLLLAYWADLDWIGLDCGILILTSFTPPKLFLLGHAFVDEGYAIWIMGPKIYEWMDGYSMDLDPHSFANGTERSIPPHIS